MSHSNSTVSLVDPSSKVTYLEAVQQFKLQNQPQTSNAARIARKVANVAFASFASLGVLLVLAATIFTILATHGVAAFLIPFVGKAAALALFQLASTVAPIATYAAGATLGFSALSGITSLALKE